MWDAIRKGGLMMGPLFLCSVLSLWIVLAKLWSLRRGKVIRAEIVRTIEEIGGPEGVAGALRVCELIPGPFSSIVGTFLENADRPKEEIKELLEDEGRQQIRVLEKGLAILETVAGVAPLLGLLGTVLGMIKAFTVIAQEGVGRPELLSVGISEALITTVAGLSIGIPALVFHTYFANKAEGLVLEIERHTSKLLRQLLSEQLCASRTRDGDGSPSTSPR